MAPSRKQYSSAASHNSGKKLVGNYGTAARRQYSTPTRRPKSVTPVYTESRDDEPDPDLIGEKDEDSDFSESEDEFQETEGESSDEDVGAETHENGDLKEDDSQGSGSDSEEDEVEDIEKESRSNTRLKTPKYINMAQGKENGERASISLTS